MIRAKTNNLLRRLISLFALLSVIFISYAQPQPLPAKKAFRLIEVSIKDNKQLVTTWDIAKEYYLYHDRFTFSVNNKNIVLGTPHFPKTDIYKQFPTGENMKAYTGKFNILIPLYKLKPITGPVQLKIHFQGCSELGLCYPALTEIKKINVNNVAISTPAEVKSALHQGQSEQSLIINLLKTKSLLTIILAFFIMGTLLSLTPCVLPMIPILSSIIVGQKKITHLHSFLLALTYVLAMAFTYAILGLFVGLIGAKIQADLQQPWIITLFAIIFILMALSQFGLYELQLPNALRHRVAELSAHQKHGTYLGTVAMGILSTLILSPCATPALAGAIIYIGDKGNSLLGATSLFAMGLGMGIPLLILGLFGPKLLPKAGHWMNTVKYFFGIVLLGMAIYTLSRLLPDSASLALWALLAIGCAIALGTFHSVRGTLAQLGKLFGIILFVYGILLALGAITGATSPLKPITFNQQTNTLLTFTKVESLTKLHKALRLAKQANKPVLLDYYASWCVDCQEMDDTTFRDPTVKQLANHFVVLRIDVTTNNQETTRLQQKFKVIAPPTLVFLNNQGQEIKQSRLVGLTSSDKLSTTLRTILDQAP